MNKLQCLAFLFAFALSTPVLAAPATQVDSKTLSVTAPTIALKTSSNASIVFLTTGSYVLDLVVSQTSSGLANLSSGYSYIWEISRSTNQVLRTVANLRDPLLPGQPSTLTASFDVTNGADVKYAWFYGVGATRTTATMTTTISQITAVPGPEAGAGLGALAMAGAFLLFRSRHKKLLADK